MPFLNRGMGLMGGGGAPWYIVPGKTCVAAYKPKGAASLAVSYINLVSPGTLDITATSAPELNAYGWLFSANRLDIALTWQKTWTIAVRADANPGGSGTRLVECCADAMYIVPNNTLSAPNAATFNNGGFYNSGSVNLADSVFGIASAKAYINGANVGAITDGALSAGTFHIGNRNDNARPFIGGCAAISIYSDTLTDAENAALHARMAAL